MTILIVEDDENSRILLETALAASGFKVESAENGKVALSIAERTSPDLIISDILMPEMDGYALCREIKRSEKLQAIPFIFYTATYTDPGDEKLAMDLGAAKFLLKPMEIDLLLHEIKVVLDSAKADQKSPSHEPQDNGSALQTDYSKAIAKKLDKKVRELEEQKSKLEASEQKYRRIFENSVVGFFASTPAGQFTTVNSAFAKMLKYDSPEELMASISDIAAQYYVNPDDRKQYQQILQRDGKVDAFEFRARCKDGSHIWVSNSTRAYFDDDGNVFRYEGVINDITDRKRAEEALQSSERKLHAIFDHHYQLTGLVDTEGRLLAANRTALRFARVEESQVIGQYFWDGPWWDHSQRTELRNSFERAVKGEFVRFETTHPTSDGGTRSIDFSLSPVRDEEGSVIYVVPEGRDITEMKRSEQEKRKLQKLLNQSQKMEAIGTLAGGIAHDFNNILSAILGYAELIEMELTEDSLVYGYAHRVKTAGNRAKDLVQQILTFSRQAEQEVKPVSVKLVVKEALKLLRASLPTSIDINQNTRSSALVMGDPTQVHQIIMNLCTNAGHAMQSNGGTLAVDLADVVIDDASQQQLSGIQPGRYLNVTISDTGEGMLPEILEKIFDPFFTTKERGEGTGLGLSVVHGIVTSYGGTIYAYSEPGIGSSFKVYLPTIENTTESKADFYEETPVGEGRILFVDDEPDIVAIGSKMLENLGYQIVPCTSSIEALELIRDQPQRFDLVITDMTMPKMNGDKLAAEILSIRKDIPIILCTGFAYPIEEAKAQTLGIKGVLMKPILRVELARTVSKALNTAKRTTGN